MARLKREQCTKQTEQNKSSLVINLMSILPTQTQASSVDSPSLSPNNSSHGNHSFTSSFSRANSYPPIPPSDSGLLAPVAADSGGSSRKVTELVTPIGKRNLTYHNGDTYSLTHSGGRGVGSVQSKGKMSGTSASPQTQQSTGSIGSQGGGTHSSGRRAQMINANHLLNFQYDPIARLQPRPTPPRRPQKIRPYNKDLFLQANYKFVVLDTGNYASELMDPDKTLRWEDIICVRYSSPFPVQCPICLEYPLCPQITSCGHIFCFPCILLYLLMGEEDHKGNCFKRCPLCFVMVSQKDLYTIYIENVKQYCVGDTIEFMLLTRQKYSFTPSQKNKQETDTVPSCSDDVYDPFSKFTFTSDVELSVRKAISDLDGWLARADSGLVDDLEKLPYVCAAMEQLELRKKYWIEQQACLSDRTNKHTNGQKRSQGHMSTKHVTSTGPVPCNSISATPSIDVNHLDKWLDNSTVDVAKSFEEQDTILSTSCDESKSLQRPTIDSRDVEHKDSYNFYQALDGQHLILHPLNMKCLLHHYGSYDMLPHRITGKILQLETVTQSEAIRRRYRYLSHFSLTTTFQLCEIDLSVILPPDALLPFMDEIKKREKQRKQLANKEWKEKIKAEVAAAAAYSMPNLSSFGQSFHDESPNFSMDDFEALGISTPMSSSPPIVGEKKTLFSNVARFGFAAGHDSPALKVEETSAPQNKVTNDSPGGNGSRNSATPSFASIISKAKSGENLDAAKANEIGKKGKRPSRVLLSTTTGRRY